VRTSHRLHFHGHLAPLPWAGFTFPPALLRRPPPPSLLPPLQPRHAPRPAGFAFAAFTCHQHAQAAIQAVNGQQLRGRPVAADWAVGKAAYQQAQELGIAVAAPQAAGGGGEGPAGSGEEGEGSEEGDEEEGDDDDDDAELDSSDGEDGSEDESAGEVLGG